jgi:hypothetical protein
MIVLKFNSFQNYRKYYTIQTQTDLNWSKTRGGGPHEVAKGKGKRKTSVLIFKQIILKKVFLFSFFLFLLPPHAARNL